MEQVVFLAFGQLNLRIVLLARLARRLAPLLCRMAAFLVSIVLCL